MINLTRRQAQKIEDKLNDMISTKNLYRIADSVRFVHARAEFDNGGIVTIENLSTGERVPFENGLFKNGFGTQINFAR